MLPFLNVICDLQPGCLRIRSGIYPAQRICAFRTLPSLHISDKSPFYSGLYYVFMVAKCKNTVIMLCGSCVLFRSVSGKFAWMNICECMKLYVLEYNGVCKNDVQYECEICNYDWNKFFEDSVCLVSLFGLLCLDSVPCRTECGIHGVCMQASQIKLYKFPFQIRFLHRFGLCLFRTYSGHKGAVQMFS